MKTNYLALSFVFILASCSQDKKAELADLKLQQKDIEAQIKTLEKEVGVSAEKTEKVKIIPVTVTPLANTTFKHFVEVQGNVEAINTAMVSPQMGGLLINVLIHEGDVVSKGQLIATVDNAILKESISEVKQQWDLANTLFEKQKNLWDQQIGTEVQYLQAKNNKESLEKRLVTLQTQLGMSKVVAPIAGSIEKLLQKTGEMGAPGVPIAQIVSTGGLKIRAKVADTYLGTVRKGDVMTVKFPDTNQELKATISIVSKTVNAISRTFDVEANIPNLGGQLKPNQLAVININDQTKANALVINQNLIQKTEQGDLVYVAVQEGNKKIAKARTVKTGLTYNGEIEITEGLKAGDVLITQGYQELVDGQVISY